MMQQLSTPCSLRHKRKLTSPGDLLGSGKKQQSILKFLSPSSSSEKASSSSSSTPQRMSNRDENASVSSQPKIKRSKRGKLSKNVSAKRQLYVTDSSSEDESLFKKDPTEDCKNKESKDLSKGRSKNMPVKRKLSLVELSREDKSFCENGQTKYCDIKESKDVPRDCFVNTKRNSFENREEPIQTVVVISSSDDSDFELHTSKKSHDVASQCLVRRSTSCIKEDQLTSTFSWKPSEVLHSFTETPIGPGVLATSTPNDERVGVNEGLRNTESVSVKVEESEISGAIQDDVNQMVFRRFSDGSSSSKSLIAVEDQSSACASHKKNVKRFCSKLKSSSAISGGPDTPRNENLTSGTELNNHEPFRTPILEPVVVKIEESGTNHSLVLETPEHKVIEHQNGENRSTMEGGPSVYASQTKCPEAFPCYTPTEQTMASDEGVLNLETDKTPILGSIAVKMEASDTIELLQDETTDILINGPSISSTSPTKYRNVVVSSSGDDDGEEDSFYQAGNVVGRMCSGNKNESGFSDSTINMSNASETCNGRISDSDDSQFEELCFRQNSLVIDDSEEASFEILPPTPTASEDDHDSHIFDLETDDRNSADINAGVNISSASARALENVQSPYIYDQETNVQNSAENIRGSPACESRSTDINYEDAANLNITSKNSNTDVYCSFAEKANSNQLQDSGHCTLKQEYESSPKSTGSEVPKTSGKSSCSIESKDITNDSAVEISDEPSSRSFISEALPTEADPPATIPRSYLKGVELSSKISCGVLSEPNPHVTSDRPENSSFPANSGNSIDHSYTKRSSVNEIVLLDAVVSECKRFAALAFDQEPLRTFLNFYSALTVDEKTAFHSILIVSLADEDRWQRCPCHFQDRMDRLASMNLIEYIDDHEDSLKLIDKLTNLEIISIFSSIGIKAPVSEEDIREILILACKDDSQFGCMEKVKYAVKAMARKKFVKIKSDVIFCVKMCLELVSMSLNLHDNVYRSVDIAKCFGEIVRLSSYDIIHLLPLQLDNSINLINSVQEYNDFLNFCKLKAAFESGCLKDASWITISASMAMLDFSSSQNMLLKETPLFRLIYTNMVYILNEELKRNVLIPCLGDDFDSQIFFSLGILLKQDFTGFGLKAGWSKRKVKCLSKLFNINNADVLCDMLQQNVSAVEHIIRSEFIAGLLENKNFGFSLKDKLNVVTHLKPKTHTKVLVETVSRKNDVGFVNYKILVSGKKVSFRRPCLVEKYSPDFKYGLLDCGLVLLNTVFLVFWPVIYARLDNVFVSRYQNCPLDWGSKRWKLIQMRMASIEEQGVQGVIHETKSLIEKFCGCRSVVDWTVVSSAARDMYSILEILGLNRFSLIANYLLQHLDERETGLPDLVVWNESPPKIKFVAFKKPSDPLHFHQVVWLEKLSEMRVDAEECQIIPKKLQTPAIAVETSG